MLLVCFFMASIACGADSTIRFEAVNVYLDTKSEPLAAYQIYVRAIKGDVKIVGIEGGEPAAFKQPPFYDPKAIQHERVVLAAFSTKQRSELPKGRIRVATIHLEVIGDVEPKFEVKLQAAATDDGTKISPKLSIEPVKP